MRSSLLAAALLITTFVPSTFCETSPIEMLHAGRTGAQQALSIINTDQVQRTRIGGDDLYVIDFGDDPYTENAWQLKYNVNRESPRRTGVLEVEFLDQGAGVHLAVTLVDGKAISPSRTVSYTRLNTGNLRSSYFEFTLPALSGDENVMIQLTGVQYLRAVRAHRVFSEEEWQQAYDAVPKDVAPLVSLERPMQIVCSAGVTVLGSREALESSIKNLHELAPLAKVLGFTSIESYVRWDLVEPSEGNFDFGFYDALVEKISQYGLKWFPLLIVGSAYSLPDWFAQSDENVGFVCLEHGEENLIQSIWSPFHQRHVTRFLQAFGGHYEPMGVLEGVRLGPSGNYGESQYPAGGNWGYQGRGMHIHIGFWAGDAYAEADFRETVREKYRTIDALNEAWGTAYASFDEVKPQMLQHLQSKRHRIDFSRWYTESMSDWCEWWAVEARKAMPKTVIDQSAGGWGFLEAGTDYADQAASMVKIGGGIRLTNETDSFIQNFAVTRLGATAARLYGVGLGYEPASSHTARGTVGRIFNTSTTGGEHFFTYSNNIFNSQLSIEKWLAHYHYFDARQEPVVDVAVYYPETMNQLDGGAFRHLYGWGFYPRANAVRNVIEVDYLNERLIREGYLDRYKALVMVWGNVIEADVQGVIDEWVQAGGTLFYPSFPKGNQETVEDDTSIFKKWSAGNTGKGAFFRFPGDMEPTSLYAKYIETKLKESDRLNPLTQTALDIQHPDNVFFSVQEDGYLMILNYNDEPVRVTLPDERVVSVQAYCIGRVKL